MLPTGRGVITDKVITLDLVNIFICHFQQYFVLPITNPIILGNDFLDTHFAVLAIDVQRIHINIYIYIYSLLIPHEKSTNNHK